MHHSVYFWLKEEYQNEKDRAFFEQGLQRCVDIDHVSTGGWGKPAATPKRDVKDDTWDYALYCTFDSIAEHDAYHEHPEHDIFVDSCKHMWGDAKVLDAE